jgi:hypothetical protein
MPLLRRPHDHRRVLRPWRCTPRPAVVPSRGQHRDAMTAAVTSSHRSPTGGRFRCRNPVAPWPPNVGAIAPVPPNSPRRKEHGQRFDGCNRRSTTYSVAQRITRPRRPAVKSP